MAELSPQRRLEEKPLWRVTVQEMGKDRTGSSSSPTRRLTCDLGQVMQRLSASISSDSSQLMATSAERTDWKPEEEEPCWEAMSIHRLHGSNIAYVGSNSGSHALWASAVSLSCLPSPGEVISNDLCLCSNNLSVDR